MTFSPALHLRFFFFFLNAVLQKPPTAGSQHACARRSYVGGDRHRYRVKRAGTRSARQKNHRQKKSSEETRSTEKKYKRIAKTALPLRLQASPARGTPSMPSPKPTQQGGLLSATAGPSWSPRLEPLSPWSSDSHHSGVTSPCLLLAPLYR